MANESGKDVLDEEIIPADDATVWKARAEELENRIGRGRDSRKQMRERYESEISGLKAQIQVAADQGKESKPDEKMLKKIETALLRASGYSDPEEIAVFDRWAKDTGKSSDDLLDHPALMKVIKAEIDDIRTAKANAAATNHIEGGAGGGGSKTDANYWLNRNEVPPSTPEYKKVREDMRRIMVEKESGKNL